MLMKHAPQKVDNSAPAARIVHALLMAEDEVSRDREHIWIIGMDVSNTTKYVELIALGTADEAIFSPRDVFRMALIKGCTRIIMVHNHPSGSLVASTQDKAVAEQLTKASELLQIELLDNLIINSAGRYYSTEHPTGGSIYMMRRELRLDISMIQSASTQALPPSVLGGSLLSQDTTGEQVWCFFGNLAIYANKTWYPGPNWPGYGRIK